MTPAPSAPQTALLLSIVQRHVLNALDGLTGPKTLVLGHAIAGILGLAVDVSVLRQHGVDKLFYLEPGAAHRQGWVKNIVYVCHARTPLMRLIAEQISNAPPNHTHTLLIAPRLSSVCRSTLQDEGVLGSVDIRELPTGLIPLEPDLLSLETPSSFREIFHDGNYSPVYEMAHALMVFQRAFGLIPRIIGKGTYALKLATTLERLRKELPKNRSSAQSTASSKASSLFPGQVDSMVVLDRSVDMVTPLCTQLTYSGLIDEYMGIHHGHVEVEANNQNSSNVAQSPSTSTSSASFSTASKKRKHHLASSTDALYSELRDLNFAVVGGVLNRAARRISTDYEGRHSAKTPSQLRDFAGKLGGLQADHQSLRLHTGITEEIMKQTTFESFDRILEVQQNLIAGVNVSSQETSIKGLLSQEIGARSILRLMCLYSQVNGGVKQKVLEDFKREFLQTYGYDYLSLFISLASPSINLLTRTTNTKSAFSAVRRPLRLIVDEVDEQSPNDMSYVYSGYAPLLARLVQGATEERRRTGSGDASNTFTALNGWKGMEETLRNLPGGPYFEKTQRFDTSQPPKTTSQSPYITLVCILGGCTYAEVAALRWLTQKQPNRKLIICTTDMVNGTSLLSDLSLVPL